jgi:hypothetical protein
VSPLIGRVLERLVEELCARGQLELKPGVSPSALAQSLGADLAGAQGFAQLGPFLGAALERSPLVEELFASNRDIVALVNQLSV